MPKVVTRGFGAKAIVGRGMTPGASLTPSPANGSIITRGIGAKTIIARGLAFAPAREGLTIRQAIAAALSADPGVSAAVGTNVYPIMIPEGDAPPALTFQFISNSNGQALASPNGVATARIKFTSESKDFAVCDLALEAVRQLFDGYRGPLPGGNTCQGIFQDNDDDEYSEPDDATDRGTYTIATVYRIHYKLAKPRRFS